MRGLVLVALCAAGCDGASSEDNRLTADDYVPEDVRARFDEMPEHVVTCVRFQYVVSSRIIECSQDHAQVSFVEETMNGQGYVGHCEQTTAGAFPAETAAGCLDTWANAGCGDLAGPPGGDCLITASWAAPGD